MSELKKPTRINTFIRALGLSLVIIGLLMIQTTYSAIGNMRVYYWMFVLTGTVVTATGFVLLTFKMK